MQKKDSRKAQRRVNLVASLSAHNRECTSCIRSENCELQALCREYGVKEYPYDGAKKEAHIDDLSPSIVRDSSKCVYCRRCVATCTNIQKVGAIGVSKPGTFTCASPTGLQSSMQTSASSKRFFPEQCRIW